MTCATKEMPAMISTAGARSARRRRVMMPARSDVAAGTAVTPDEWEAPLGMDPMGTAPFTKQPSHGRFAQQRIGREGADGNQRHQPRHQSGGGLLGEPAEDGAPPAPIGAHQQQDAEEQKRDAKEDVLPQAAKALVDAAEQQPQHADRKSTRL